MKCEHTIISQDTPLPPSIIQEIEDFWRQKDSNPFVWQSVRWIEFLLKSRQIQEGVCSLLYDKGMLCGYALTQVRSVGIGQF